MYGQQTSLKRFQFSWLIAVSSIVIEEIHILFETTVFHIKQAQQNPLKIAFTMFSLMLFIAFNYDRRKYIKALKTLYLDLS